MLPIQVATGRYSDMFWLGYAHATSGEPMPADMSANQREAYHYGKQAGNADKDG